MKLKKLTNGYIMGGTNILIVSTFPDEILFKGKMYDLRFNWNEFKKIKNQKVVFLRDKWSDEKEHCLVIQIEKPKNFQPIIIDFDLYDLIESAKDEIKKLHFHLEAEIEVDEDVINL